MSLMAVRDMLGRKATKFCLKISSVVCGRWSMRRSRSKAPDITTNSIPLPCTRLSIGILRRLMGRSESKAAWNAILGWHTLTDLTRFLHVYSSCSKLTPLRVVIGAVGGLVGAETLAQAFDTFYASSIWQTYASLPGIWLVYYGFIPIPPPKSQKLASSTWRVI